MLTLKKLEKILTQNFGEPFLPKDTLRAFIVDGELTISIGPRDVTIDKSGNVVDAGTFLG